MSNIRNMKKRNNLLGPLNQTKIEATVFLGIGLNE